MKKVRVALYGHNGHQVGAQLAGIPEAELAAICGIPVGQSAFDDAGADRYERLEQLLEREDIDAISICSPVRSMQFHDIKAALLAGKHVYAEKPLVMEEGQLDELLRLAASKGLRLREMASTAYESPYAEIREAVVAGMIGEVVQVAAQKSYPYADWRPQDERVDGGLLLQVGIHAVRWVEQVALQRIAAVSAFQTKLGNPTANGGLHMAASLQMRLQNGGIAQAAMNYLNRAGSGIWGSDQLRIFGTLGYIECLDGGRQVRVVNDEGVTSIEPHSTVKRLSHFHSFIQEVGGRSSELLPMETEIRALRVILGARESAERQGALIDV
ncbi:Gfo/Idh/MocA family protein [Paenibacillus silvisoli]|uniref:Gfo/Idh/MocA family protein n=1 Tax=Paenibacillus silvisoli TaxID=3110539 RepID=UPI002805B049|nr:Gfo/Idh/MocA family oxidoreductase [Paenibacillus silvisoli]